MTDLHALLETAPRPRLLHYLAAAIHGFTIMARDPDESDAGRAEINNRIHYLAGHLMGLTDFDAALDPGRTNGILEQVGHLHPSLAARIEAKLREP